MSRLITSFLGLRLLAQAYGAGTYGSVAYGTGVIQLGPLTLPNTGTTWLGMASLVLIAIGVGLFVWLHQRKKTVRTPQGS